MQKQYYLLEHLIYKIEDSVNFIPDKSYYGGYHIINIFNQFPYKTEYDIQYIKYILTHILYFIAYYREKTTQFIANPINATANVSTKKSTTALYHIKYFRKEHLYASAYIFYYSQQALTNL